MPAYKEKDAKTWYVSVRYEDWTGKKTRKVKRGFATKREALEWERKFLLKENASLDMTFDSFLELYKKDLKDRLKLSTWIMKTSVIDQKILPYFKNKRMCDIKTSDVIAWQKEIMAYRDEDGNVDPERTSLNRRYCNRNIKKVYEELFGEALEKYNAKQTRSDRKIKNYYEKIRTSKQEKPFTELVMQIGNHEDTNAQSEFGAKAAEILDEYMKGFQERNPHLRVFSAYMHMDESTPHLHIDFVPFTTGSKRGLETRVSLKSALAQQGITGGTKYETEWSVFTRREKEQLLLQPALQ